MDSKATIWMERDAEKWQRFYQSIGIRNVGLERKRRVLRNNYWELREWEQWWALLVENITQLQANPLFVFLEKYCKKAQG